MCLCTSAGVTVVFMFSVHFPVIVQLLYHAVAFFAANKDVYNCILVSFGLFHYELIHLTFDLYLSEKLLVLLQPYS